MLQKIVSRRKRTNMTTTLNSLRGGVSPGFQREKLGAEAQFWQSGRVQAGLEICQTWLYAAAPLQ